MRNYYANYYYHPIPKASYLNSSVAICWILNWVLAALFASILTSGLFISAREVDNSSDVIVGHFSLGSEARSTHIISCNDKNGCDEVTNNSQDEQQRHGRFFYKRNKQQVNKPKKHYYKNSNSNNDNYNNNYNYNRHYNNSTMSNQSSILKNGGNLSPLFGGHVVGSTNSILRSPANAMSSASPAAVAVGGAEQVGALVGQKPPPQVILDPVTFIESKGYKVERHYVTTLDGYILCLHRLVVSRLRSHVKRSLKPVLIQHGLLASSLSWVTNSNELDHEDFDSESLMRDMFNNENKIRVKGSSLHNSLAFTLADQGYDVWLANSRGNTFSANHTFLNVDKDHLYWSFSFHEMAVNDLPAVIKHVLANSDHTTLGYIGHSQGAMIMLALMSQQPQISRLVKPFVAMAPVAYLKGLYGGRLNSLVRLVDTRSLAGTYIGSVLRQKPRFADQINRLCTYRFIAPLCGVFARLLNMNISGNIVPTGDSQQFQAQQSSQVQASLVQRPHQQHQQPSTLAGVASQPVAVSGGAGTGTQTMLQGISISASPANQPITTTNSHSLPSAGLSTLPGSSSSESMSLIPDWVIQNPAGTSFLNILHYIQMAQTGIFSAFDFGTEESNMRRYGRRRPPIYDLAKVNSSDIILVSGSHDIFSHPEDVERLRKSLKVKPRHDYVVPNWTHFDYTDASNASHVVNLKIVEWLEDYRGSSNYGALTRCKLGD